MISFPVKNRWTGDVQFVAQIECAEDAPVSIKLGLAVRWAVKNKAVLTGAVLRGADLTGAVLRGADLTGANLTGADLTGAVLTGADLTDADLRGANLTGADLRGANLTGADLTGACLTRAPFKIKNIHQKVYAAASKPNALDMTHWHTCETTHCRAGWVVTLAGEAGKVLEWAYGTQAAANLIYLASDPNIGKMPDFYDNNSAALADMKERAEAEAARNGGVK